MLSQRKKETFPLRGLRMFVEPIRYIHFLPFLYLHTIKTSPALSDEDTEYLFLKKVPELDFAELSLAGLSFFDTYLKYINWKNNKLEKDEHQTFIVRSFDMIGIDNLWRIALETTDPAVGKAAILHLNNFHKHVTIFCMK